MVLQNGPLESARALPHYKDSEQTRTVLLVSLYPSHPPMGGRMSRLLQLAKAIRQTGFRPILLYQDFVRGDRKALGRFWGPDLRWVRYRAQDPVWCLKRLLRQLLPAHSLVHRWAVRSQRQRCEHEQFIVRLDDFYDPALSSHVRELCQREKPCACICLDVFMTRSFEAVPGSVLRILDTNDLYAVGRKDLDSDGSLWVKLSLQDELRGFNRADLIWTIQERDERIVRHVAPDLYVRTVGHLVDLAPPDFEQSLRSRSVLFVASKHKWNVQGLRWFATEVFPLVTHSLPGLDIQVAGDIADILSRELPFTFLGRVPDLSAAYRAARLVISPILGGGGLKIKNIEPMGYGKALVSTRSAATGLEAAENRAFLVGENAATFAEAVIRVVHDDGLCRRLMQGAYAFAQEWNRNVLTQLRSSLETSELSQQSRPQPVLVDDLNHVR